MNKNSIIPLSLIKIEDGGYHLMINVTINDKNAKMIVDTGASKTVFDFNSIKSYINKEKLIDNEVLSTGLGSNSLSSKFVNIKNLKLGDIEINRYKAVIIDMANVIETYTKLGLEPFVGILGCDILLKLNANIDFKTKELKLSRRINPKFSKSIIQ